MLSNSRLPFNEIPSKYLEIVFNKFQPTDIRAIYEHCIPLDSPYFLFPRWWVSRTNFHILSSSFKWYWDISIAALTGTSKFEHFELENTKNFNFLENRFSYPYDEVEDILTILQFHLLLFFMKNLCYGDQK